ncbi:hypothetical protein BBZ63_09480 [Neisseria gonorrhoeae]|nr:hypothetical protein BBZ63_09480 [Neisseria gonorrhoeae]
MTKYKFPRGQIRIPACASDSLANQTACNRQICRNLLPPPWGRAGEAAFSKLRQPFPTTQPPKYKPCGLLPSLQPSPTGREDGEAVGVKGFVN